MEFSRERGVEAASRWTNSHAEPSMSSLILYRNKQRILGTWYLPKMLWHLPRAFCNHRTLSLMSFPRGHSACLEQSFPNVSAYDGSCSLCHITLVGNPQVTCTSHVSGCSFVSFSFLILVSCSSGWLQTAYAAQVALQLPISL